MTALRECLRKAVAAVNGPLLTDKSNEQAGWAAVSFLQSHGAELLSILDAEGDGGAAGALGEIAGLIRECEQNAGKVSDFYAWEMIGRMSKILESTQFHPQPARSGGVSDEQVDSACSAYIAADRFLLDGAVDSMREPMRAALLAVAHLLPSGERGKVDGVVPSIERIGWDKECDDVDRIIEKLGMTIEQARTEGGCLHLPRILNHIQETFDALALATEFGGHMSDKYVAAIHAANHPPAHAAQVDVGDAYTRAGLRIKEHFAKHPPTAEPVAQDETVEPSWVTTLRKELLMSKMTHNFTLTRDELIYLLGNHLAVQPRAVPDGWVNRAARCAEAMMNQSGLLANVPATRDDEGKGLAHLRWMTEQLASRSIESPTKACRWLGYIQAMLISRGMSTLDAEKRRNLLSAAAPSPGESQA